MVAILVIRDIHHAPFPQYLLTKWQRIVNLLPKIAGVSTGVINRADQPYIENLVVSENQDNPFQAGERHHLDTDPFCKAVITQRAPIMIANTRQDSDWHHSPDHHSPDKTWEVVSYFGVPLLWPDGEIFGTFCVIGNAEVQFADEYQDLHSEFKKVIEEDLRKLTKTTYEPSLPIEALKETEDRVHQLFDSSPIPYQSLDSNGRFIEANQALQETLGYTREELLGRDFAHFVPEEFLPVFREHFAELKKIGQISADFELLCKDKKRISVQLFGRITNQADGYLKQTHCVWFDITERKHTELALQESEATARALLNTPSVLTALLDGNGFVLDANEAMAARFNKSRETMIGCCIWDFLPDEVLKIRKPHIMTAFNAGKIQHWEDFRAGSWFESCANPVFDENGKITKVAIVAYDVTERKIAQEALKKSERKYRELVDEAATIILRWDVKGNVTFFNEYAQSFFGFKEEEILGKNVVGTIVPETEFTGRDLALLMEEICHDPAKFEDNENENIKRNGERVWIAWKNRPIYNNDGELFEIHSVGIDITARKRAEDALRKSETLWRSIADNSADHIVTLDTNLNIEYVNFCSPGLTKEQLIGTPLYNYVSEEQRAEIKAIREKALTTGQTCTYETQYDIPDGGTIYYESIAAPRILSDSIIGLTVNARNITAHKRAEQTLRRSEIFELLAIDASLDDILAALVASAENRDPDILCTILLLDKDNNQLHIGAASERFPQAFKELSGGMEIDPSVCLSGGAAFTGERVIAEDVLLHPDWLNYRELAENIGLRSCWSEPIISTASEVLGAITIYHRPPYTPHQADLDFIQDSARLAGIAIERKQSEASLRESEQRYRGLVELSPDGVVVHDYNGKILFANTAATKLVGATDTSQWFGQHINKFIHPDFHEGAADLTAQIIREHQPSQRIEQKFITLAAREIDVEVSGVPLVYGGKPAIQIIAHDISARKRAEEKIRASEKELAAILDSIQDVYYRTDANGVVTKISPSVQNVFGYKPQELVGKKIADFWVNPQDRERLLEALRNHGGAVQDFETMVKHKGGAQRWASANSHFYMGKTGNIAGVEGTIRDITERKQSEHELHQSRRHFQNLDRISNVLSSAPDLNSMLWDVIKETLAIFNADRAWLLYPCDPDTPTWRVPVEVTRPEYPGAFTQGVELPTDPYVAQIFREAILAADPVSRSFTHDDTDPEWVRHFNIQSQLTVAVSPKVDKPWLLGMHQCSHNREWTEEDKRLFRDIAERVTNALTNRLLLEKLEADIEERKRTEKELERQKTLFETVFNDVPDAMLLANTQRAIVMCNPAFSRVFGYETTELIGKKTDILYESLEEFERQGRIRFSLEAEEKPKPYIINYKRKNREIFPGETVGTPIKTKSGDTLGFIGVIRDITERKLAEERARQHQAELAHMARLNTMGELATGIAHELNQPLAAIANYAAACRKMLDASDNRSERLVKALEATQIQAKRASDIVRHLRQFVRKQNPQKTHISLNSLIESVLSFMRPELNKRGIILHLELQGGLPDVIADSIQIEQVLVNLLQNSIGAMNHVDIDHRQLTIVTRISKEQCTVEVEVADTGTGMDAETLNTIFEPFVTTKGDKGMGLGLSISRSIIEAHDGRLWVESRVGSGSRFYFTLPTVVKR